MSVKVNEKYLNGFIKESEFSDIWLQVENAHRQLTECSGAGADFLGWSDLPEDYDREEFARIKKAAAEIRESSDVLIVIGIGGSYLGTRAAIEFSKSQLYNEFSDNGLKVYFAGNTISAQYTREILALCEGKRVSVNVISKSGTTTEPAVAFRIFKEYLEKRFGKEEARKRIYATTDRSRGTLRALAEREGYTTFVIPDDVGGRFSVLSSVGLLAMAAVGVDIDEMMRGAYDSMKRFSEFGSDNDCYRYAAARNILYRRGKAIEVLVAYEPKLTMFCEWYKQLFGESEGKDGKGIYPASVINSTDLHSMGQFIQDGTRNLFETVVNIKVPAADIVIEREEEDFDGLNYLAGMNLSHVNEMAMQGTILAHNAGGVPNIVVDVDDNSPYSFGYLVYFFERACAISGYLMGINPFNQPGVEAYKKNMFALLGKPGYEELRAELEEKLK